MTIRRRLQNFLNPVPEIPAWQFYLRILLVALMLTAAYIMAVDADPFFYQGF